MMSDGRMMQKTDLAVKMVKTSPRGRNLRAAMLVKKRNPVKNPRVTTRSFSLKVKKYPLLNKLKIAVKMVKMTLMKANPTPT